MEKTFEKINKLYEEYQRAIDLGENIEVAIKGFTWKIVLAALTPKGASQDSDLNVKEIKKSAYGKYVDEVRKVVIDCLKWFPESETRKNGAPFSKYLFKSLENAINTAKGEEIQEHVNTTELEKTNDEGETFSILDTLLEDNDTDPLGKSLIKEDLQKLIPKIQEEWKKDHDQMLSEILTVLLLKMEFDLTDIYRRLYRATLQNLLLYGFNYEILMNYTFIDKELLDAYSADHDFKPDFKEIVTKYNVDKSTVSKKLSRFFEPFKESLKNF